jgi:hypothetical protein
MGYVCQYPVPADPGCPGLVTKLTHAESGQWQSSLAVVPLPKADPQGVGIADFGFIGFDVLGGFIDFRHFHHTSLGFLNLVPHPPDSIEFKPLFDIVIVNKLVPMEILKKFSISEFIAIAILEKRSERGPFRRRRRLEYGPCRGPIRKRCVRNDCSNFVFFLGGLKVC